MSDTPSKKRKLDEEEGENGRQTAKRLTSCDLNNTISILVGSTEKPYTAHKDIICAKSRFVKAACSKRWIEGQQKVVKLPDVAPDVFQRYLSWVYSGHLDWNGPGYQDRNNKAAVKEMGMMQDLYLVGDSLDDVRLRNRAMELLVVNSDLSAISQFDRIYQHTPVNSPLRKMYVERHLARIVRDNLVENIKRYPTEFVQELAVASSREVDIVGRHEFTRSCRRIWRLYPLISD